MAQTATSTSPILIIGSGISGLALAQGLRLHSIPFRLFERHSATHSAQGHRFRLSAESVSALNTILLPQSKDLFARTAPEVGKFEPRYVDAKKFKFEQPTPLPSGSQQSIPIDRGWLRDVMMVGIEDAIEFEKEFIHYELVGDGVRVSFADGYSANGQLLVGADGVRSRVRRQLQPERRLLDLKRWAMWGRTMLTDHLRARLSEDQLSWFMAIDQEANVQLVAEPMVWSKSVREESETKLPDYQDYIYWVLCTESGQTPPRTAQERKEYLDKTTEAWHPGMKTILQEAAHEMSACVPILSSKPDIEFQSLNQKAMVTLLGDSAHAMSPMGGSGGATAVFNAVDLAHNISQHGATEKIIKEFEERMSSRAKEKIEHSFRGGMKFWKGKEWFEYSVAQN